MKTLKKIAAVVLVLAVVASFATLFTVSAAATNLALTATVSANVHNLAAMPLSNINDGNKTTRSLTYAREVTSTQDGTMVDHVATIDFTFASAQNVNKVDLYADAEADKYGFRDVAIDVKLADGSWKRVAEVHDVTMTNGALQSMKFATVSTTCVRVLCNSTNQSANGATGNGTYAAFAEVEIYNDSAVTSADYTGIKSATVANTYIPLSRTNVAKGGTVTSVLSDQVTTYKLSNATDGAYDRTLTGPTDCAIVGFNANKLGDFNIVLPAAATIDSVNLKLCRMESTKRPKDIAIDVKLEDGSWKRVAEMHATGDINPVWGDETAKINYYLFHFEAVKATAVRVIGKCDGGNFRVNEIEVYEAIEGISYTKATVVNDASYYLVHAGIDTAAAGMEIPLTVENKPSTGTPSTGTPSTGTPSTGTPSTGKPSTSLPKTGDNTNAVAVMVALVAAGFVCAVASKARKA